MKITDFNIIIISKFGNKNRRKLNEYIFKNKEIHFIESIEALKLLDNEYRKKISNLLNIPQTKLCLNWFYQNDNFKKRSKLYEKLAVDVSLFLSHFYAIKYAYDNNFKNVLIIEDDCELLENAENIEFELPENFDMIYFGGLIQNNWKCFELEKNKFCLINPEEMKVHGTFSYALEKIPYFYESFKRVFKSEPKYFDTIQRFINSDCKIRGSTPDTFFINFIQRQRNSYIFYPCIFGHRYLYPDEYNIGCLSFEQRYKNINLNHNLYDSKFRKLDYYVSF
jgi:hypothetical protein